MLFCYTQIDIDILQQTNKHVLKLHFLALGDKQDHFYKESEISLQVGNFIENLL